MINKLNEINWPVVLVDNSPVPLSHQNFNVKYIHCPANVGIAAAQNEGIQALQDMGAEYGLVLDQDSQLTEELLFGLLSEYQSATHHFTQVAAIGPMIVCEFNNAPVQPRLQKALQLKDGLAEVRQIIASGMLINLSMFNAIGKKDEALFIDGVDHEWCWRARYKGFSIVQSHNIKMRHRQGDARHRILGLNFKRGAPVRLYYQVRNVLILSRRQYVPLYWKCRHLPVLPLRWAVNRWWFPEGKLRGHYVLRGLIDGIKGRTGKIDSM
nr:glycosyltransferase family 2 protein [Alteromonas pelagimontana]